MDSRAVAKQVGIEVDALTIAEWTRIQNAILEGHTQGYNEGYSACLKQMFNAQTKVVNPLP